MADRMVGERERMTEERLAYLRRLSAVRALSCDDGTELLRELDAVRAERDALRKLLARALGVAEDGLEHVPTSHF